MILRFDTPALAPDIFFLRKVTETFKHVALAIEADGVNHSLIEFLPNPYLANNAEFENWIRATLYPFIPSDLGIVFVYV
jgi:hypothetical protein